MANDRRKFCMALGGVLALPRFALAQQAERTYRVCWLSSAAVRTKPTISPSGSGCASSGLPRGAIW